MVDSVCQKSLWEDAATYECKADNTHSLDDEYDVQYIKVDVLGKMNTLQLLIILETGNTHFITHCTGDRPYTFCYSSHWRQATHRGYTFYYPTHFRQTLYNALLTPHTVHRPHRMVLKECGPCVAAAARNLTN